METHQATQGSTQDRRRSGLSCLTGTSWSALSAAPPGSNCHLKLISQIHPAFLLRLLCGSPWHQAPASPVVLQAGASQEVLESDRVWVHSPAGQHPRCPTGREDFGKPAGCSRYQLHFTALGDLRQVTSPVWTSFLGCKMSTRVCGEGTRDLEPEAGMASLAPGTDHVTFGEVTQHPCSWVPQPPLQRRGNKTARAVGWLWTGKR
ncbi:uncharacterized protein LOC121139348 [Mesocricetus auratus]|uniref:Uncharacterized protein LOC121139348 n=1 Tax=Mesocricetus auratus TaxID=10036 RepID=A0ABM2XB96_MESAU|nr:uncharacterized protein LOC121139348 [Mesocricetus auratus]